MSSLRLGGSSVLLLLLAGCSGEPDGGDSARENTLPGAPGVGIAPQSPTTLDDLVVVIRSASVDADGDDVSYAYAWFQDGYPRTDLTGDTVPASETAKGEVWEVQVTPQDGRGAGAASLAAVTVVNTPPALTLAWAADAPSTLNDLLALPTPVDVDGDAVTYTWSWTVDGAATDFVTDAVPADATRRGEEWAVTVTPHDGEAAGEAASIEVEIVNSPPVCHRVSIAPDAPYVTDAVVATVEGEDADGDEIAWTYAWRVDGAVVQEGDSDTLPVGAFAKHQTIVVDATPRDDADAGETLSSDPEEAANSLPGGTGAAVSPAVATEASTLACVGEGFTDADGDPEGWATTWYVGGTVVAASDTIDGSLFSRGDSVYCTAAPDDGEGQGPAVVAPAVTIENTAPVVSAVTLSSLAPGELDTLTAAVTAADADGDPITLRYSWRVNGRAVADTETLSGASFDRGDSVQLEVTPSDDTSVGVALASSVATVANTAPVVTGATLSSSSPLTDDTLTVDVSAYDADEDAVSWTYAWYVDGALAGTDATLAGDLFEKYEAIRVVVTPSDDAASGAPVTSDTATVANAPPTAPGVTLSPERVVDGDDLVCTVTTESTDADGDTLTYRFAWDVDGVPYVGSTDSAMESTVRGSDVYVEDTWTCTVTVDDGDGGTNVASDATYQWSPSSWTLVYSHALTSTSGLSMSNGSLGGQGISSVGSRSCFRQYSDWNTASLGPTRSSNEYEAVEVDLYFPSSGSSGATFYLYGGELWFSVSGVTWSFGDSVTLGSGSWTRNAWVTTRVVVDHVFYTADVYVGGVLVLDDVALTSPGAYTSTGIGMNSSGSYGSTATKACWSNLEIYEGDL
jgi:hypothetical protein